MEISKSYDPSQIEKKWYQFWQEQGYFTPTIDPDKEPFTVLIPPPNVTGILHMGHVLNNTLQDVVVRYKRMTGVPTLWIPGVDHAGIATQNVVEKQLAKEGKTRHDIGREELIQLIWKWKEEKGGRIIEQLKQLGASCDWTRERFTMDEGLSKAVKEVFVHLYEKDLIYKGKYIINWCPRCVTALANDEVEHEDEEGHLWHIHYPFVDGSGYLTVATTRPETMLGDVAVAVNPQDDRYKHLVGKMLLLPIVNREIPIIADMYVDKEFGTGCVKVTPAHDPNDFEMGQRHQLAQILVMDEHGKMNENAGVEYQGLDRFEARTKIVAALESQKLLEKVEKHQHAVGHCYRCDTAIEPYLSDQWFVKMKPLAVPAIKAVLDGDIKFQPERWTKVFMHWMDNIRDWCISRQIWWGHRIPAYYCEKCGKMEVAREMPQTCSACGHNVFRQDEDVLDTWFSSWLWPFSTMGWPDKTADLQYFLPTSQLITAPEIIYLWVARMIMATMEFEGKIPFHTVLLHGTVRDELGRKMSKSLGNSPDPIDIIERVGADALRFSMIFNTPKGADSYYSDTILETGRNFANKIWNAYRFVMGNVEKIEGLPELDNMQLELADRWIYSRLQEVTAEVTAQYESLRFNDAAQILMQFIWDEYCAWYLELSKDRIYNEADPEGQRVAKYVLLDVLQQGMRLLHPIMPFITEEIWQGVKVYLPQPEAVLITAAFPVAKLEQIDASIADDMAFMQESITAVRNLRKQVNLAPSLEVKIHVKAADERQVQLFEEYKKYFLKLAKVVEMSVSSSLQKPKAAIAAVVRNVEIYLPLEGLIDLEQEKEKLHKQLEKLDKELASVETKLNNDNFVRNAKPEVVDKERERLTDIQTRKQITQDLLQGLE